MLNSTLPSEGHEPSPDDVEAIVRRGPSGAIALAGIATFVVLALWLAFYLFVFIPRSGSQ